LNKFQNTNPKFQISTKHQSPNDQNEEKKAPFEFVWVIGIWNLEFVCDLVLGVWNFPFARSIPFLPVT
jgi:hypothetical protein